MVLIDSLNDFYFPLTIICLIIGYQISLYFFYLFFKVKDEKIGLNYFLVAMGAFYLFGITGVIILSINSYYITDVPLSNILGHLAHILISIGVILFQIVVSLKDFHELINRKISKVISVLTIVLSISILLIEDISLLDLIILIAVSIGVIYVCYFHIKLIKLTAGEIRKRIKVFFIGEMIMLSAILLGAEKKEAVFSQQVQSIVHLLFILLLLIGLLITFLGSYRFPMFLEIKWRDNILKLYIIDQDSFKIIYTYDFTKSEENDKIFSQKLILPESRILFSSGMKGINEIFAGITNIEEGKLKKIEHGNFKILIESGTEPFSFIMYCLLVKKEMKSVYYFQNVIKYEFEDLYHHILLNSQVINGSEEKIFSGFDLVINKLFN